MFKNKHKKALRAVLIVLQPELDLFGEIIEKESTPNFKEFFNRVQGIVNTGNAMYQGDFDIGSAMTQRSSNNMRE